MEIPKQLSRRTRIEIVAASVLFIAGCGSGYSVDDAVELAQIARADAQAAKTLCEDLELQISDLEYRLDM